MSDVTAPPQVGTEIPPELPAQTGAVTVVVSTPADSPKPGYQSTEFYVALLTFIAPIVRALTGNDVTSSINEWSTAASGIVGGAYVLSRAFVKTAHTKAVSSTPDPVV